MHTLRKHISLLLLAVFSVLLVPKEVVHGFVSHKGVVHHHIDLSKEGQAKHIDNTHQHCQLLNFQLSFYDVEKLEVSTTTKVKQTSYKEVCSHKIISLKVSLSHLRGPPFVC
ncbi:MAG: hypothetical protein NTX03_10320 [Bacteroidetes bacterium]|nr:hypothetical protein [Bacteroidota bacterium]